MEIRLWKKITMPHENRSVTRKMLRSVLFTLPVAIFCGYQTSFADSILNKCTDGNRLTYTDKPCEKLGLQDAGPLNNTVTEIIAPPHPQIPQHEAQANEVSGTHISKPAKIKPVKLLLDKTTNF